MDGDLMEVVRVPPHEHGEDRRSGTLGKEHRSFERGNEVAEKIDPGLRGGCVLINLKQKDPVFF